MLCKILKGSITTDELKPDGAHGDVTYNEGEVADLPEAMIALHPEYCQRLTPEEATAHTAMQQKENAEHAADDARQQLADAQAALEEATAADDQPMVLVQQGAITRIERMLAEAEATIQAADTALQALPAQDRAVFHGKPPVRVARDNPLSPSPSVQKKP